MGKSAPKAPDYTAAAEKQGQSSKEVTNMQTWANRPDQYTPFGETTWSPTATRDPATGQMVTRWTQNTELNPLSQEALDSQLRVTRDRSQLAESLTGRMQDEFGQPMDFSGLTPLGEAPESQAFQFGQYSPEDIQRSVSTEGLPGLDPSQRYFQQAGDAIWNQWASRNLPAQSAEQDKIRNQLYNAGLKEGDAAYTNEMNRLQQQQNDARQQAAYQATIGAGQEAQRMLGMDQSTRQQLFGENLSAGNFYNQAAQQALAQQLGLGGQQFGENLAYNNQMFNQGLAGANFQNQTRQQQLVEAMQQRGWTLNEINAMLNGQQVGMPTMPSFSNASKADTTQYLDAAKSQYQSSLDAFNAQQAATQGMISAAGSVAGAFMPSDRRLKRNVKKIGSVKGVNLYSFDYVWGEKAIGVMADEVAHIPGAVAIHPSGYAMVNYGVIYG